MSIVAKLYIDDKTFNILKFNVNFNQKSSNNGLPSSKPTGGLFSIVFETTKETLFYEWMVGNNTMKNLKIVLSPSTLTSKSRTIELFDAYCLKHEENFDGINNKPMMTYIQVSPAIMVQDGVKLFEWYWKVTDLSANAEQTVLDNQQPIPSITNINWIHPETKEILQEITYKESIALTALIENQESDAVTITITKEDGTEFENGETELIFEESINEDGEIELTTLEIKEQWEEFKTADIDKLIAKVDHNGYQKKSSALQVVPSPKVLVNFRTGNGYKGEYGFDWLRMGDTGKKGDVFYKDIIGSYATGSFVQSDAEYVKLGKLFEMPQHPIKANDKYVVPVLTLLPTKKATLTLKVEVEGSDAKKIEYKFDKNFFKLDKTEVSHKTVGKKELANDLTIECIKEFGTDQFIEVESDGKFAGKFKVKANNKAHRYKADIVFVQVETALLGIGSNKTGTPSGREAEFTKYFNQALSNAKYETVSLDLSSDTVFNTNYSAGGNILNGTSDAIQNHLNTALYDEFDSKGKDYRKHYKIYFINEKFGGIYGRAYGIPSANRSVVIYALGFADSTVAHETFHAMGLYHPFNGTPKFFFDRSKTDNIMDYSDVENSPPIPVISSWQWQWDILWNNLDKE
ncbi:type VI secretion system tube protein TssD [Lacinutrix mariniflava]|uniref:type VI secretion system tube protein TssD n=1 Tax=Lacinutrix mariniflava TaxID=342955 RepID=UPI0006E40AC2|nr:type VI secretion system tube protein TssD [Lacinutrix mariniflava]